MKRFLLSIIIINNIFFAYAQTPTLDGVISPGEGWTSIATADNIASPTFGSIGIQAKQLYFTNDNNYYYFAATVSVLQNVNTWAFIINTQLGNGGDLDPRPRQIFYGHTEKPDFVITGSFQPGITQYESYEWLGSWNAPIVSQPTDMSHNITQAFTTDGVLEIRVPKTLLGTNLTSLDLQFYISGADDVNGSFDAIPNDNNAPDEGTPTSLSQYVHVNIATPPPPPPPAPFPTLDGVISPGEGWNNIATGDNIASPTFGGMGIKAKQLYFTSDNTYYYFAATVSVLQNENTWAFIINTQLGNGGDVDPRPRQIFYTHAEKPDFVIAGTFQPGITQYESYGWPGSWNAPIFSQPTDMSHNITQAFTTDGVLEIRVPKTLLGTNLTSLDLQFYISGIDNVNGSFDAIPNDNNAPDEGTPTSLSQYVHVNIATPMPLTLLNFNSVLNGTTVNLYWQTTQEVNVSHFEIEESIDGIVWKKYGSKIALNNTTNTNYDFSIYDMKEKLMMYRLKMVDKDGTFTYSKAISIKANLSGSSEIHLLGNPVKNEIKLSISDDETKMYQVDLFSSEGKRVLNTAYKHTAGTTFASFTIPSIHAGVYKLRLSSGREIQTLNVIVQ